MSPVVQEQPIPFSAQLWAIIGLQANWRASTETSALGWGAATTAEAKRRVTAAKSCISVTALG